MNPWNRGPTKAEPVASSWGPTAAQKVAAKIVESADAAKVSSKPVVRFSADIKAAVEEAEVVEVFGSVLLDPLVMLRIQDSYFVKSDTATSNDLVYGLLFGCESSFLNADEEVKNNHLDSLEITNCFSVPSLTTIAHASTREAFMTRLKDLPIDYNCVGMFVTCSYGNFCTPTVIKACLAMQKQLDIHGKARSVLIVYDSKLVSFTAYRVSETGPKLLQPVAIRMNTGIYDGFTAGKVLDGQPRTSLSRLSLAVEPRLEEGFERVLEELGKIETEENQRQYYERTLAKQMQSRQGWINARRAENQARVEKGQEPLPEYDYSSSVFKDLSHLKPNPLVLKTLKEQASIFCDLIQGFVSSTLPKIYLTKKE